MRVSTAALPDFEEREGTGGEEEEGKEKVYRRSDESEDRKSKLILGLMIGATVFGLVLLGLLAWAKGREAG